MTCSFHGVVCLVGDVSGDNDWSQREPLAKFDYTGSSICFSGCAPPGNVGCDGIFII